MALGVSRRLHLPEIEQNGRKSTAESWQTGRSQSRINAWASALNLENIPVIPPAEGSKEVEKDKGLVHSLLQSGLQESS